MCVCGSLRSLLLFYFSLDTPIPTHPRPILLEIENYSLFRYHFALFGAVGAVGLDSADQMCVVVVLVVSLKLLSLLSDSDRVGCIFYYSSCLFYSLCNCVSQGVTFCLFDLQCSIFTVLNADSQTTTLADASHTDTNPARTLNNHRHAAQQQGAASAPLFGAFPFLSFFGTFLLTPLRFIHSLARRSGGGPSLAPGLAAPLHRRRTARQGVTPGNPPAYFHFYIFIIFILTLDENNTTPGFCGILSLFEVSNCCAPLRREEHSWFMGIVG